MIEMHMYSTISTLNNSSFLKIFPIVARYADQLAEKLGRTNLDESIDVKQYVVNLLYDTI